MAYGKKQLQRDPLDRRTWSRVFSGRVVDTTNGEKGGGTWQPENALHLNSSLILFKTDCRAGWAALPVDNALQVNLTLKFFKPDRRDGRAALPVDNALQMNSTLKFFNLDIHYNTIQSIAWGSLRIGASWDGRPTMHILHATPTEILMAVSVQRAGQGNTDHLHLREVHVGDLSANPGQVPGLRIGFAVHELPLHLNDAGRCAHSE